MRDDDRHGALVKRFSLTAVGVQYQQGLKDSCAASDFAEGAISNAERFPIPDENGEIVCPDAPIPASTRWIWVAPSRR